MKKQEKILTYLYESMQKVLDYLYEIDSGLKVSSEDTALELEVVQSILNVSRSTLFKMRKQGKIHFMKFGNKAYVLRGELKRYLQQNKTVREDELQF